ncbi:MAG TPA: N-acetyltransferase [Blastocatellia bacterium]|nr:N-acetyltransferase [Blastocatellia bacterium]
MSLRLFVLPEHCYTDHRVTINIRLEEIEDQRAVRRVNELAFGQTMEADLVDGLRTNARPHISLVATVEERIVGHIFFSPVSIESETGSSIAMGLAPMSVLPEFQNQGIGSRLVDEGLKKCRELGHSIVVVLGHPNYYPRFGFIPAHLKGLRSEYDVPDDTFMVLELSENALAGRRGLVRYHPEFSRF